ncbi:MAG TPA: CbiQ family ECF transporter T component [Jatrophihabitans sp.]|nr:CbiQ family ECF transporter T component [Jatrophihabitans sp.]
MPVRAPGGRRLPRGLHPVAWWLWAGGLAVAASRTSNPVLLALLLAVLGYVVSARRTEAAWARGFKYYLWFALIVVGVRVLFRSVFGTPVTSADHVLFSLPRLPMPSWYAGVQLGGPVSLEATLAAALDGLRLACILCCVGAANSLANPKRALRVLPGALYELGVAVTVSISVAPQLIDSVQRVHRARRLRAGGRSGLRGLRSVAVPVLADALARSLQLAAAMDSRGYGRAGTASRASRRLTAGLLLRGMFGLAAGTYGLLDSSLPGGFGLPVLLAGASLCCGGLLAGNRRLGRTSYRPDPWRAPEWLVSGSGLLAAGGVILAGRLQPEALNPVPLSWPPLPPLAAVAILLAATAGIAAPPPVRLPAANRREPAERRSERAEELAEERPGYAMSDGTAP